MSKVKVFLSDYADMCNRHLSRVFRKVKVPPVSRFHALDLTMEVDLIRVEDGTFQNCTVNK